MQSEPKRLIYDWTNTLENEVTANCSAAGRPSAQIFPSISLSTRSSRSVTWYSPAVRVRTMSVSTAEASCAITVAIATPAIPIRNTATNTISSTVLTTADTTRK